MNLGFGDKNWSANPNNTDIVIFLKFNPRKEAKQK